jgi:hypothetical protein
MLRIRLRVHLPCRDEGGGGQADTRRCAFQIKSPQLHAPNPPGHGVVRHPVARLAHLRRVQVHAVGPDVPAVGRRGWGGGRGWAKGLVCDVETCVVERKGGSVATGAGGRMAGCPAPFPCPWLPLLLPLLLPSLQPYSSPTYTQGFRVMFPSPPFTNPKPSLEALQVGRGGGIEGGVCAAVARLAHQSGLHGCVKEVWRRWERGVKEVRERGVCAALARLARQPGLHGRGAEEV